MLDAADPQAGTRRCDRAVPSASSVATTARPHEHASVAPAPLALLAARAVALARPLDEIAACLEYLPLTVRRTLYTHLTHERLRGLEISWTRAQEQRNSSSESDDSWHLEHETEHEWHVRSKAASAGESLHIHHHHSSSSSSSSSGTMAAASSATRKRSFRQAFWEHRFRVLLRARVAQEQWQQQQAIVSDSANANASAAQATTTARDSSAEPALHLFQDVVEHLKVHGREVVPRNVVLIRTLQTLQRLEVHHPEQQRTCWPSLLELIETHASLTALCFFHGKLGDEQVEHIRHALQARATRAAAAAAAGAGGDRPIRAITALELVSLKLRPRGYRELVALLEHCDALTSVRLSNCLTDVASASLVATALQRPHLATLALEHNDLDDDVFTSIHTTQAPMALRHLRLNSNAISVATLRGICTASLDGFLKLTRLELRNNVEIGDASVHALAPMLASTGVTLTHLDLNNCSIGLEGATTLLLALETNASVTHLDIGHNFFGSRVGDLLASFLRANTHVTSLQLNYVGLGTAGCTEALRDALAHNSSLKDVAFGANRLRDDGADVLFQALVERARKLRLPFATVDLSGNLLTHKGLGALAHTVERAEATSDDAHADRSDTGEALLKRQKRSTRHRPSGASGPEARECWIHDLSLLDNNFPRDLDANEHAFAALRTRVGVVRTNTWVGKRNVYDDEV